MEQITLSDQEYQEIDLLTFLNDPRYSEERKRRRKAEWANDARPSVADAMLRLQRDDDDNSHNGEG